MPQMRDKILRVLVMFPRSNQGQGGEVLSSGNGCDPDEKDLVPWSRLVFVYMNKSQSFITEMFWIKPLNTLYINNIKVSQSFELDHCFLFWQNLSKQTAAVPFLTLPEHFSLGECFLKFTFGSFFQSPFAYLANLIGTALPLISLWPCLQHCGHEPWAL